jgi:hypothetical protein
MPVLSSLARTVCRVVGAVPLALSLVASPSARADAWQSFQFSAGHPGHNAAEAAFTPDNVRDLRIAFKAHFGSDAASEGGAVINPDGQIFVAGFDGKLSAFALAGCGADSCEPLWQGASDGADFTSTPAATSDEVLIASADHFLHAFPARGCGREQCDSLWRGQLSAASIDSSVALAGGLAFVGDFAGRLSVFALGGCGHAICQPLWTGVSGPHEQINSAPAVGNGFVYVQTTIATENDTTGRLLAFPLAGCGQATCAPTWTADIGGPSGITSSPLVLQDKVIVGSNRRSGNQPDGRKHLFAFDAAGCGASVCKPVQIFGGTSEGVGTTPALSVDEGTLFVGSNQSIGRNTVGVVTAYDLANCGKHCKPLWAGINPSQGAVSPPAVVGDLVFVGKGPASFLKNDAGVYAFDARGCGKTHCQALKFVQAEERSVYLGAPLAIANGRITFVSTDFNSLASNVSVIALP